MKSKITGGDTELLFTKIILNKYEVKYYKCLQTGFIQTEHPYWLSQAYENVITSLDVGLTNRNLKYAEQIERLIIENFNTQGKFLDYGGGIGLFVRLMRDKGFNFFLYDIYAPNILALGFNFTELKKQENFELITAFEVFEHLVNPIEDIELMLSHGQSVLFSTELIPAENSELEKWWYFLPETGQHIAFYSYETLLFLAKKYKLNLYSNHKDLHLLTNKTYNSNPLIIKKPSIFDKILMSLNLKKQIHKNNQLKSLIGHDFEYISKKLIENNK
jgi:hypothetical protein